MAILKNVASQKLGVFAYDSTTGAAKSGDAANITAYISLDFAAPAQTNDVNPTELDAVNAPGWYVFDLTQAETNAEVIVLAPKSVTASILVEQIQVITQDAALSTIEALVDDIGVAGAGLTAIPWNAAWDAEVQSEATDALNAYDPPTKAEMDTAHGTLASAIDAVDNYVDSEVAAIKVVTDKLGTALEADGAVYRFTENALEEMPNTTVTISAAEGAAIATGAIAIRTHYSFEQGIDSDSTEDLSTATLVFAIKRDKDELDSAAQVLMDSDTGLTVMAGAAYATAADGSIVLSGSSGDWTATLTLEPDAAALLSEGIHQAELKAHWSTGKAVCLWTGEAVVLTGIVRTLP